MSLRVKRQSCWTQLIEAIDLAAAPVSLLAIERAIRDVYCALDLSGPQVPAWSSLTEDDLWQELIACVLGSRVRFEIAYSAVQRIEEMGLLSRSRRSSHFEQYEQDVMKALSGESLTQDSIEPPSRYPFFRIRANQIRRAAERLYGRCGSIREFLAAAGDVREARRRLASEVTGLGPKQASLFLRNSGYTAHVAVLDVHVLTYMSWVGLSDRPVKSVSTIRAYESLEDTLIEHSYEFGYRPDRFDLAVWIVVKVAKEEYKTWE